MNYVPFQIKKQYIIFLFCSLFAMTTSIMSKIEQEQTPHFQIPSFCPITKTCKLVIVIPAYNEEKRIEKSLTTYIQYFKTCTQVTAHFLVVCNNCSDNTVAICKRLQKTHPELNYLDLQPGGKGFAVKQGFLKALEYKNIDYIGFVDADLATQPPYFYELITEIQGHDGAIASRYKKGARVWPNRPFIRKIGGQFYNWILRHNFHFDVRDTQCGAKLFTYNTIKTVATHMKETGWSFDLELLYLCQLFDKDIVEVATTWSDIPGSHLKISGSYKEFISAPIRIKQQNKKLAHQLKQEKELQQAHERKQKKLKKKNSQNPVFIASGWHNPKTQA
jgi:dolichyl-phosphate beta-glucosyltransferase